MRNSILGGRKKVDGKKLCTGLLTALRPRVSLVAIKANRDKLPLLCLLRWPSAILTKMSVWIEPGLGFCQPV